VLVSAVEGAMKKKRTRAADKPPAGGNYKS
jgi:hypothetical protein